MKKLKAEIFDKFQFLFRYYYDRVSHVILMYENNLDENILKKVFMEIVRQAPVLHSTFKANLIKPYWVVNEDYTIDDIYKFIETDNLEKTIDDNVIDVIPYAAKTQIKFKHIRCKNKDALIILANHMCYDGGDVKYINMKIAESYSNLLNDPNYKITVKNGSRALEQVYEKFNAEDEKIARKLYKNVSSVKHKIKIPYSKKSKNDTSRIIKTVVDKDTFLKLKDKCKSFGVTVNDLFIALYAKAIYKFSNMNENQSLTIPCMIDLRRHTQKGDTAGITNLTGFMTCTLDKGFGKNIFDTLKNVKESIEKEKTDKFIGLYGLPLIKLAYKLFPNFIAEWAILLGYTHPYIGMSNIGVINAKELKMGNVNLENAWFTGTVKYKPYIQLAMTTFNNEITLTMCVKCNDEDEKMLRNILEYIKYELNIFINQ